MGQVFIILGLLSAVLTVILFRGMNQQPAQVEAPTKTKELVVAVRSIPKGEAIGRGDVKKVDWPEELYPKPESYKNPKDIIGRVTSTDILAGQPVFKLNLAEKGARSGITNLIPNGFRAITISVSESKAVAGFIKPGDHIDVLATFEIRVAKEAKESLPVVPWENNVPLTDTVVQDITVLAIAQELDEKQLPYEDDEDEDEGDKDKKKSDSAKVVSTLTLAVTPEQAEKIAFSEERGKLKVVLRNHNDQQKPVLIGTVTDSIVDLQDALAKALADKGQTRAPRPKVVPMGPPQEPAPISTVGTVEVIKGTESTVVSF
ncbi:MAG: Flp pilus assembly protein CpaB [Cyanobacteria bacterium HKST-UBA04]|nr:Flp pilus assembly protein CpaB [Cyanobacteria bacterium HKST-UBA04]MCA9840737.1 Flp pilus assembly protein CpaB [Cyanobacteria bacterium HKST-UBA03]